MKRTKSKPARRHATTPLHKQTGAQRLPFISHVRELRKRLFYIAVTVIVFGGIAYTLNKPIAALLLQPAGDQQFIYTTPGGGFDFLFKLCLYTGIAASIPVIVYQLLRYLQPLMKRDAMTFIMRGSIASGILAVVGILFGYIYGLPAAMHFLLQGFSSNQIQALISIQSYMSFVMLYLLGSALLFQVPLVLILINRLKPLQPKKLMQFQRWFIVFAFILGAVINPSPNIQDQLMLSVPMILMYQVGIALVWWINRRGQRPKKVIDLMQKDAETRAARKSDFEKAQEIWRQALQGTQASPATTTAYKPAMKTVVQTAQPPTRIERPRQYLQDFSKRPGRPLPRRIAPAE